MKKLYIYITLIFISLLTACGTTPVERIVVKTDTKVIKTPDYLLTSCFTTAPPTKESYLVLSNWQKKEAALVDYSNSLLKDLNICNNQILNIKDFQNKEIFNITTKVK